MTRIFVRRKWLTDFHLINMKLTWNLCYSSSHGGDELLDEEFILVLFLLLHWCIMCMWYKRDWMLSLLLSLCLEELASLMFAESLWVWWLSLHKNLSDVSQRLCVNCCCCLNKTCWRFFSLLFMKGMPIFLPILFVESEIISEMIFMYHDWITIHILGNMQRQILVNSSQIKKKDIAKWAMSFNTTVKHNEHADQK